MPVDAKVISIEARVCFRQLRDTMDSTSSAELGVMASIGEPLLS